MIFQHSWQKVLSGEKTQTRRLYKVGQLLECDTGRSSTSPLEWEVQDSKRTIYRVRNTYAVQPARTAKAIGRIMITAIRREDVREISVEDVKAEGFKSRLEFMFTWCGMHDKEMCRAHPDGTWLEIPITTQIERWFSHTHKRPADRYQAWALTFELVEASNEH